MAPVAGRAFSSSESTWLVSLIYFCPLKAFESLAFALSQVLGDLKTMLGPGLILGT